MNRFKRITHLCALGLAAVAAFFMSPAGQELVKQYPKLSGISALTVSLVALYHSPKK